jgi:DNA primase
VRFSEETIEQVRQAVDLVELIGGQVQLRKAGQTWKGLCPFHEERTPSFTVNPDRQAYHCFGCGAGGDAFRFVMEVDKLPFLDAVRALAERYGVTLPQAAEEDQAGKLHRALEEAQTFYRRALEDPETGRVARAYLAERGLSDGILEEFGAGYAPAGWDALSSRLTASVGAQALLDAGLTIRREKGEGAYDRFRNRVLVPLRLPSGKVVGFGGRALGDETPKYLNSPETPVYRKGKFLFGLDRARAAFKLRSEAVLVEGYFDVIALAQAGVEEVVATSGTALTLDQCRLLKRYVPRVLLVFDGDSAGQAAAEKALPLTTAAGLAARVVILPEGEDPDTLVRTGGMAAWEVAVAGAKSPVEFLAARHAADREEALRACARLAAAAEDPISARLVIEEAARALAFDESALGREVERIKAGGRARFTPAAAKAAGPGGLAPEPGPQPAAGRMKNSDLGVDAATRSLETGFLAVLVAHPGLLEEAQRRVLPGWFRDPACAALVAALLGPPLKDPGTLLGDPELAPAVRALLSALMASAHDRDRPEKELEDGITRFTERALKDEQRALQHELRQAVTDRAPDPRVHEIQTRMQDVAAALRAQRASEARRKERA